MNNFEIVNLKLENDYKIIVISDIHGNYPLFYELINNLDIDEDTYLIFNGDYINRYPFSHETLQLLMEIKKKHKRCYFNLGNHEYSLLDLINNFENLTEKDIQGYTRGTSLWNIFSYWAKTEDFTTYTKEEQFKSVQLVRDSIKQELDFLNSMSLAIVTDDFIFVHAGIDENLSKTTDKRKVENYGFYRQKHLEKQTVVVGHWPAKSIPDTSKISNEVIFMKDERKIFEDGGNSLDMVGLFDLYGQINALMITKKDNVITYDTTSNEWKNYYRINQDVEKFYDGSVILGMHNHNISISDYDDDFYLIKETKTNHVGLLLKEFYKKYPFPSSYCGKFFKLKKGEIVNVRCQFSHYSIIKYNCEYGLVNNKYLSRV